MCEIGIFEWIGKWLWGEVSLPVVSAALKIFSPEKAAGMNLLCQLSHCFGYIKISTLFSVSCHPHNDKNRKFKVFLSWINGIEVFDK